MPKATSPDRKSVSSTSRRSPPKKATKASQRNLEEETDSAVAAAMSAPSGQADNQPTITPEARMEMIRETAYYIAEKHNFDSARERQNWLEAEAEVDARLQQQKRSIH